jgi:hypothetical protein
MTIVLILISDALFGNAAQTVTVWGLGGAAVIIAAFAVLARDMLKAA